MGIALTAKGDILVADSYNNAIRRVTRSGVVSTLTLTRLSYPSGVAVCPTTGSVFVADSGNKLVNQYTAQGELVRSFGGAATFTSPWAIAIDVAGDLIVTDCADDFIKKISPVDGSVSTIVGGPRRQHFIPGISRPVDGPAKVAQLRDPRGVAVDCFNNIYVADAGTAHCHSSKWLTTPQAATASEKLPRKET
eukprot:TRINITY_DN353_c0_g1_i1.p1 TRINITY_DN353_c0_g1~~TRINITY_DN353_c0_g1_i1.p1  ORF type:complete len:193 (-),score=10.44 TRINITY_DN353_c0_g1_i1:374-952(-)